MDLKGVMVFQLIWRVAPVYIGKAPARSAAGVDQLVQHLLQILIGEMAQLVVRAILDWMRHKHIGRVCPQRFRLGSDGLHKFGRGDTDNRYAAAFEVCHVMRTARRARASIAQRFDNHINLCGNLLAKRDRRRPRICRLCIALHIEAAFG